MFTISYIITTRNRISFLKITLGKLLQSLAENEEIVVVDGNSTDGTKEYLQQLFDEGQIHQYISGPDRNQAHGWNKALLMARGVFIKKIIDDDVYDLQAIRKCAACMIQNPKSDICISANLTADLLSPQNINYHTRIAYFKKWANKGIPCFTFSDVTMLIKRSSLSYLGLYDTQFTMMDWEYSLRCTHLQANIVYYPGCNALSVNTPGNVTSAATAALLKHEGEIGKQKYGYQGDRGDISLFSEFKIAVGRMINYKKAGIRQPEVNSKMPGPQELETIYNQLYRDLEQYNKTHTDQPFLNSHN